MTDNDDLVAAIPLATAGYVILSYDWYDEPDEPTAFHPATAPDKWVQTEGDEAYEFDYDGITPEGSIGHHVKWCAELTGDELRAFMDEMGWEPEDGSPTLGSITEYGLLAAASYDCREGWSPWSVIDGNAYISIATEDAHD